MAKTGLDLISTADIARLAGQSRATVGNWKARNPDFRPSVAAVRGARSTTGRRSPGGLSPQADSTSNPMRSLSSGASPTN